MPQYREGRKAPWMVQWRDMGKVKTRSFTRKQDAIEFEGKVQIDRQRVKAGLAAPLDEILLIDFAKRWIRKRYAEMPLGTVKNDDSRLKNFWLPRFGVRPMQSISTAEVLEALDELQYEMKKTVATRNRYRALMHKLFQDAFMEGKVLVNPISRIPLKPEPIKSKQVLSWEEQGRYLEALRAEGIHYWMLGQLLLWTGARICSANALQFQDIDWEASVVQVRRLEDRALGEVVERQKGKGEGGETLVPLFPRLRDAIDAFRSETKWTRPQDYIASKPEGGFIPYDTFKDVHRRAITEAKVTRVTIHDLRRTFATNAERAGYSKSEIKDMLGHSTVLVTERYTKKDISHLVEKGKRIGFGAGLQDVVVSITGGAKR